MILKLGIGLEQCILEITLEVQQILIFSYDVWLGSDRLAYANLKKNGTTVGKYRVNSSGQLEHYKNGGWNVVSSTFYFIIII